MTLHAVSRPSCFAFTSLGAGTVLRAQMSKHTFFSCVKKSMESRPPSRPIPDSLDPPKGRLRSRTSQQLTHTVPTCTSQTPVDPRCAHLHITNTSWPTQCPPAHHKHQLTHTVPTCTSQTPVDPHCAHLHITSTSWPTLCPPAHHKHQLTHTVPTCTSKTSVDPHCAHWHITNTSHMKPVCLGCHHHGWKFGLQGILSTHFGLLSNHLKSTCWKWHHHGWEFGLYGIPTVHPLEIYLLELAPSWVEIWFTWCTYCPPTIPTVHPLEIYLSELAPWWEEISSTKYTYCPPTWTLPVGNGTVHAPS